MNTTRKKGYEPIVERHRLGPNHGEEPFSIMQIITAICVGILVFGVILFVSRGFINHINKTALVQSNGNGFAF
jgi:ABC-type lipoprotein release transport system permease subunit